MSSIKVFYVLKIVDGKEVLLNIVPSKKDAAEYVHGDDLVYIVQEGVSYGSSIRTKSIFDLAGLNYLLRMKFIKSLCNNMNFTIATPSEIKKFTTGNGNCKKDQMIELFKALHPGFDLPKLDDIADSYWMANFAKKIMIGC